MPGQRGGDVPQHVLELGGRDVGERAAEDVDAAAAALGARELDRGELVDLVGRAHEQVAAGVGVEGLAPERPGRGVVADGAEVVEHVVHLGVQVAGVAAERRSKGHGVGARSSATQLADRMRAGMGVSYCRLTRRRARTAHRRRRRGAETVAMRSINCDSDSTPKPIGVIFPVKGWAR